jgi:hypothetical protein
MDSKVVSCEACHQLVDAVRVSPEPYLHTSVFSSLSTCVARCGSENCQVQHGAIENIVGHAAVVILILGMTFETVHGMRGFVDRDPHGDHLFRVLGMDAKDAVIVCYDRGNAPTPSIRRNHAGHNVLGLQGGFHDIKKKYPFLIGHCDIILNDYSTSKFFPDAFPAILSRLLTPSTGYALLRGISRRPPYVDYPSEDKVLPNLEQVLYNVRLQNLLIPVRTSCAHVRLAQVLYQAQQQSGTNISYDAIVIYAGRRLRAADTLCHVPPDSTLHIVVTLGPHFIDPYEGRFYAHEQAVYDPYPIVHNAEPNPTGVWSLVSQ